MSFLLPATRSLTGGERPYVRCPWYRVASYGVGRESSDDLSHEAIGSRDEDRNESRSCRPTDVGEYTSTYLLRACAEVAQQIDGHVAARVEQAKE